MRLERWKSTVIIVFVVGVAISLYPHPFLAKTLTGLALFVYGMTLMSDGLQQIAGAKMRSVLAYMTRNRFAAIAAGTLVTALIQSSSATTVMTVGFVNAGLLTLQQAIGVIFGANIGTTVTGQIVALDIAGVAFPTIILGVVGILASKKSTWQGTSRTLLGFGLLFFGMQMMSTELESVSSHPDFKQFFRLFDCTPQCSESGLWSPMRISSVLGAIGIGTLLTAAVQSSSATIGIVIALTSSGHLSIWTAVPIVLGDNIGTTVTALLASINTRVGARRAALSHALFNMIGTCLVVCALYVPWKNGMPLFLAAVDALTPGDCMAGDNLGRHVAMAHTLFNVSNVIVQTPFIGVLAWICRRIVRDDETTTPVRLEELLLLQPCLALECATAALTDISQKAWEATQSTLAGVKSGKVTPVEKISAVEEDINAMQLETMNYLVKLTRQRLDERQARVVPLLMHCVNDAERVADLTLLIAKRVAEKAEYDKTIFSEEAMKELVKIMDESEKIASATLEGLRNKAFNSIGLVTESVKTLKALIRVSVDNHSERLRKGRCTPTGGLVYIEVLAALENIARHMENIAERTGQLRT